MKLRKRLIGIFVVFGIISLLYFYPNLFVSGKTLYSLGLDNYHSGDHGDYSDPKKMERAAFYFEKAIDKGYNTKDVFKHLFYCYRSIGNNVGEESTYTKAISNYPNDAEFYFYRGGCRKELRNHQGACDDFSMTIKLNPKYKYISEAYFERGAMEYILGDTTSATKDRITAIKLKDDSYRSYDDYCSLWE